MDYICFMKESIDVDLTLGDEYHFVTGFGKRMRKNTLRVIKTTRKGINLLMVELDCVLYQKRHLYDRKWSGKSVPAGTRTFRVRMLKSIHDRMIPLKPAKEA